MDFDNGLERWKKRFMLKRVRYDREAFTDEVMQRVRALAARPARQSLWRWQIVLPPVALGASLAAALIGFHLIPPPAPTAVIAEQPVDPLAIYLSLAELGADEDLVDDLELLVAEVDEAQILLLAQQQTVEQDAQWLHETAVLLEAVEEEESEDAFLDEILLEEMELLDEVLLMGGLRG